MIMKMFENLKWCTNCLAMSTRPRISFDERGWCNACQWMEEKKNLDWSLRLKNLEKLLDCHRKLLQGKHYRFNDSSSRTGQGNPPFRGTEVTHAAFSHAWG